MSFYLRKSVKAGPFRFNFSKSGIGISTGIPGFRIGSGPRGNYVHMGANGIYYRKTIKPKEQGGSSNNRKTYQEPELNQPSSVVMEEIESADVLEMQDQSSKDLLVELNRKTKSIKIFPFAVISSIILLVIFANLPSFVFYLGTLLIIGGLVYIRWLDQIRKSVVLFYELEGNAQDAFQSFFNAFQELVDSSKTWHIEASGKITNLQERKRQAGAQALLKRKSIQINRTSPPYVKTNISIPSIPVGKQTLYFFPDRLLVYEGKKVGAVSYEDLQIETGNSKFIESETLPRDAKVVDHTWKYVNKKGGPDRRFKDNRQLPIALYSAIEFSSSSGLDELIQLSKCDLGEKLSHAIKELAEANQPITSKISE